MLTFAPDFDRRIDLPGAGPCPRPVDIDRSHTGFAKLVSLRVYSFAQAVVIDGEAEGDEVFIVLMTGAADIAVFQGGTQVGEFPLARNSGMRAVYLPPHAAYRLTARQACDIAYARVQPPGASVGDVAGFAPAGGRLSVVGHARGMDLSLVSGNAGERLPLVGSDGGSPERLLHVRAAERVTAVLPGASLRDWHSAAFADGEVAAIEIEGGTIERLLVSASAT